MSDKEQAEEGVKVLWGTTSRVAARRIIGCAVLAAVLIAGYSAGRIYYAGYQAKEAAHAALDKADLQEGVTYAEVIALEIPDVEPVVEEVVVIAPEPAPIPRGSVECHVVAKEITEELTRFALTNGCSTLVIPYLNYPMVCDSMNGGCDII